MSNNILTASEKMKSEYCCNIIKVGEIRPIEGSDFLGQTFINGDSVVVRKDQVKEGDIYFFAMNECQLCDTFLKANSLFREGYAEENANYAIDVQPLASEAEKYNQEISALKAKIKKLERARRFLGHVSDPEAPMKFESIIREVYPDNYTFILSIDDVNKKKMVLTDVIDDLKKNITSYEDKLKTIKQQISRKCGFFERNGRVRAIRLKGTPSFGYMFSKDELAKAYPDAANIDMEANIGLDFDTVAGELFAKPYVPKAQPTPGSGKRKNKAAKKYDRLVDGEFAFHYDTDPLGKNIWKIKPTDIVTIDVKLHGSSVILAHVKARYPEKLKWYETAANTVIKLLHLPKKWMIERFYLDYAYIPSSRKVIKNPEFNPNLSSGYYATDIWSHWGELMKDVIPQDMTVYGEIIGYENDMPDRMIQKDYDYGAEPGQNFMMPYRITTIDRENDNEVKEWDVEEVYNWTVNVLKEHPELQGLLHPIDILYHGPFCELYPDIPIDNNWHDHVLIRMSEDKELFGMEELEPLCRNKVPREGLVIRVDKDKKPCAYKLKTVMFRDYERKQVDAGIIDSEMDEGYVEDATEE